MGNYAASSLIESFRNSAQSTTLISNTNSTPPSFTLPEDIPGIAKAWVTFIGHVGVGQECQILKNSSHIHTVSCSNLGQYDVIFKGGAFNNGGYTVIGSLMSNSNIPLSAANTFFVKTTAIAGGVVPTKDRVRIQTIHVPTLSSAGNVTGAANAYRVDLLFYK
jgi:hypothetical protein